MSTHHGSKKVPQGKDYLKLLQVDMVGISSAFIYHFTHPTAFQRALDQGKVVEWLPEPETRRGVEQARKDEGTSPSPVLMGINKAAK